MTLRSVARWLNCVSALLALSAVQFAATRNSRAVDDVPEPVLQAEQSRVAAIARASRTAVSVFERGGKGGGSGVVISPDGFALTNFHVTQPCGDYMKCSMSDGKLYDAVLVGIDPVGDVALIKLLGRTDFPAAEIADSDQVRVGDWCFAVGNPFLLATDFQPTVSYGIVSGVHRYQYPAGTLLEYADCLQTDAAINPGNSGGPLYDATGRVIGVNGRCSFEKRGRVNVGVGYSISSNQLKHFLGSLHSGRIVDHATLGATVASDEQGRVIVTNILESSDAHRRGLRYGDEIVSFAGRTIGTTNAFKNVLGIFPKGWRVPLEFRRQGERKQILVRLSGVHSGEELLALIQKPAQPQPPPKKPGPKEGGPKPPPMPDQPLPPAQPNQPAPAPIPEHVAHLIKHRAGYANYFFNELERDRVWAACDAKSKCLDAAGVWTLRGEVAGTGAVELKLGPQLIAGKFGNAPVAVEFGKDLGDQLDPPGSGGLLVALHLWRHLLTSGPAKFGEVYYLGTLPVAGQTELCDVLVGTHQDVEARFLFAAGTGELVALEMYPDANVDPCEIHFYDYRDVGGHWLPQRLEVRHGDRVFGTLEIKEHELPPPGSKET